MHSLLRRQIKKYFGTKENIPEKLYPFLEKVDEAYKKFDEDRIMTEGSLDISSKELQDLNSKLTAIFYSFPDQYLIINLKGLILDYKGSINIEFKYHSDEITGKTVFEIFPETLRKSIRESIYKVKIGENLSKIELFTDLDGKTTYYEARFTKIDDQKILVVIRDITELKDSQQKLKEAYTDLEKKIEARTSELLKRNKELEISNNITQAINKSLDVNKIYKTAMDMAVSLDNVDMAMIYIVDTDSNEAVLKSYRNLPDFYLENASRVKYPRGLTWKVINEGRITNVENMAENSDVAKCGRMLGFHSALGVPIKLDNRVIGVVFFLSYKEEKFTDKEVEFLSSLGNQIALAISKARAYKELTKKNKYEKLTSTITRKVHKSIKLEYVLESAVAGLTENIENADYASIYLVEGNQAILKAHRGLPQQYIEKASVIPYPKGTTWHTIISGKPNYSPDTDKDSKIGQAGKNLGIESYLSMPITFKDEVMGTLNILSKNKNAFDQSEMQNLLYVVSQQIEAAINNARQAEESRKSEEKFRGIFESIEDVYYRIDIERNIEIISPSINHYGYESNSLLDFKIDNIFSDPATFNKLLTKLNSGQKSASTETKIITKDDVDINVLVSAHFVHDKTGKPLAVEGMIYDLTERIEKEQAVLRSEKLESLGTLAGGIAHDFNNMLTAIVGNITLANMDLHNLSKVTERLEEAEAASHRAQDLAHQLLTFAKGGKPVKKIINLNDIIKKSVEFALRGSNIEYEFSLTDSLNPVEVDEGQMNQVFNNIVLNAKQAMPDGGKIKVSTENFANSIKTENLDNPNGYIKITIEDNGTGIKKELIEKIFDPYFTTKQEGSGLGLATSYFIIKKHNGCIDVESQVGKGTKFDIYIPASESKLLSKELDGKKFVGGNAKILFMDDDELVTKVTTNMLESLGYKVDSAFNGNEAVNLYESAYQSMNPYDLVILDITVRGGMGGKDTITKLKEIDPEVKAIVSSGYSNNSIMSNFNEYGFSDVISKPFTVNQLGEIINNNLEDSAAPN